MSANVKRRQTTPFSAASDGRELRPPGSYCVRGPKFTRGAPARPAH
jgi:hypothetical protein